MTKRENKNTLTGFSYNGRNYLVDKFCDSFWNGSIDYQIQNKQTEWIVTNATISHVETKVEGARGSNYGHTSTYFDIYYEYVVDDQTYTGIIEEQNQRINIGEPLKIKYNPNIPQESTCILEPSKSFITNGTVCALLAISLISFSIYKKILKENYIYYS